MSSSLALPFSAQSNLIEQAGAYPSEQPHSMGRLLALAPNLDYPELTSLAISLTYFTQLSKMMLITVTFCL